MKALHAIFVLVHLRATDETGSQAEQIYRRCQ